MFDISAMAVNRHRRRHILGPLQAAAAALDKGRAIRQQRTQQLAAIGQGDPAAIVTAVLGMQAQVEKMQRIEARLERVADAAEQGGSPSGVAAIAGQQLRGVEVGARLAGIPAFVPRREDPGTPAVFSLVINIPGEAQPFTLNAVVSADENEDTGK
jgi:hypothetical protein